LVGRIHRSVPTIGDMLSSAGHKLPNVGFFEAKNARDFTIWVVERFPKNVRGPFCRREPLQQDENRTL
jgi:hypothetical protein